MKKTLHKIGLALSALVLTVGMGSCTDWLLVYRVSGGELELARTGTHADIFEE